ncbi:MAG: acyl-CoA dehydrogenase family protein [Parvibaculales bacterium]
MQFAFTDEQNLIRETVFAAIGEAGERNRLFKVMENDGFDREAWMLLTKELMLSGAAFAEAYGGSGLGFVELGSVQEALGRHLVPTPFLTSVIMSGMGIDLCGSEAQKKAWLPDIITGEKIVAFAHLDMSGHFTEGRCPARLAADGTLSGDISMVQYGHFADALLVLAENAAAESVLVLVDVNQDGVVITPKTSMDLTRPVSEVSLENVKPESDRILSNSEKVAKVLDIARIMLAVEQMGAAEGALELANIYAKDREQFGRPIGSFQAVKHRLADMMVMLESAKSAAWYAVCTAQEVEAEIPVAASTAAIVCSRALSKNAAHGIQLHGGMGFTWECMAHLYFKRARTSALILGSPEMHREKLADFVFTAA